MINGDWNRKTAIVSWGTVQLNLNQKQLLSLALHVYLFRLLVMFETFCCCCCYYTVQWCLKQRNCHSLCACCWSRRCATATTFMCWRRMWRTSWAGHPPWTPVWRSPLNQPGWSCRTSRECSIVSVPLLSHFLSLFYFFFLHLSFSLSVSLSLSLFFSLSPFLSPSLFLSLSVSPSVSLSLSLVWLWRAIVCVASGVPVVVKYVVVASSVPIGVEIYCSCCQ